MPQNFRLEKEGLIKPRRSKGGTRSFTDKDILKIKKILDLQENQYYTLKAIKNNPKLLLGKGEKSKIVIDNYSEHDALKKSGLKEKYKKYNSKKTLKDLFKKQ